MGNPLRHEWILAARLGMIAAAAVGGEVALPTMTALQERDTFRAAKLSTREKDEVIAAVEAISFDAPDSWEAELRVRRVALGATEGLILQGTSLLCGATGNCEMAVVRRINGKWVALFESRAPVGDGFAFLPDRSHGVSDLMIAANVSADEDNVVLYRFDGTYYQPSRCFEKRGTRVANVRCSK